MTTADVGNSSVTGTFESGEGITDSARAEASINIVSDVNGTGIVMHAGERMARSELRHSMADNVRCTMGVKR